ncbi:MAG: HTH domain-containing protein, partial [ANME-2 cluster archaeon]
MKGNLPSKLKPLILDRHERGMSGVDIAKELKCSTSIVSTYISEFKAKEQTIEAKRQTCKIRQNTLNPEIRKLCIKHDNCKTCDVG